MAKSNSQGGLIFIGLLAAAGFVFFTNVKQDLASITARVSRVKVITSLKSIINLNKIDMQVTIDITNPTKNNIEIDSITAQATYEGLLLSDMSVNEPFVIEANRVTPVVMSFKVITKMVLDKLFDAVINKKSLSPIEITGTIREATGISVPISQTLQITV